MDLKNEERLINIANEIVGMTDSVIGVTGWISELNLNDFGLLKDWYENKTGLKMVIPQDALKVRKCLIDYLKSKNISVPEEPKYDMDNKNTTNTEEFFRNWGNEDKFFKGVKR